MKFNSRKQPKIPINATRCFAFFPMQQVNNNIWLPATIPTFMLYAGSRKQAMLIAAQAINVHPKAINSMFRFRIHHIILS